MSKLSQSLKTLINSPKARPGPVPAPRTIQAVYRSIQQEAQAKRVSQPSWVALSVPLPVYSVHTEKTLV